MALPKRAIPRLNTPLRTSTSGASTSSRQRVPCACLSCRARKVKCNGEQPECSTCRSQGTRCTYATSRKDRLKSATACNQRMARLLRDLQTHVSTADKVRIEDLLQDVAGEGDDQPGSTISSALDTAPVHDGETDVSAEAGSHHDHDTVDEDLLSTEEARSTGFMGQPSEIQLMRRLHHHAERPRATAPFGPPASSATASLHRDEAAEVSKEGPRGKIPHTNFYNFYLDDQHVDLDLDIDVDPTEMPPFETAELLLLCYMGTVHDSFPFMNKKKLMMDFYNYYSTVGSGSLPTLSEKTQGLLNLVFAVGAVYSHLVDAPWQADARDHLIYHSRACHLLLIHHSNWWYTHPDVFRIQAIAMLSLYCLTIGDVNRSWLVSGMALRSAYAVGLHIRNDDPGTTAVEKEVRTRIWWGLYCLETTLSTITGRPSAALTDHCSVPFPLPISTDELEEPIIKARFGDKNQSFFAHNRARCPPANSSSASRAFFDEVPSSLNSGTYLRLASEVNMITSAVLTDLYAAATVNKSWQQVQETITRLLERLESWVGSLPPGLNILTTSPNPTQEQVSLALYYYSTKILITRPCLCRLDRRINNQTRDSDNFNRTTADACVNAAKASAALLPDGDGAAGVLAYHLTPWWSMVHFLMQGVASLLMNLLYTASDPTDDRFGMTTSLKKFLRSLRTMSATNASADRAYRNAYQLLGIVATKAEVDITDLQQEHMEYSGAPIEHAVPSATQYYHQYGQPHDFISDSNNMYWSEGGAPNVMDDFYMQANNPLQTLSNILVTTYDQQNPLPAYSAEHQNYTPGAPDYYDFNYNEQANL